MIDEKFMIKKLQEKIRSNNELFDYLEIELEKEESKKKPYEQFILRGFYVICVSLFYKVTILD